MGRRGPLRAVVQHPSSSDGKRRSKLPQPSACGITNAQLGVDLASKARTVYKEILKADHPVLRGCDAAVLGRYCIMMAIWRSLWSELCTSGVSFSNVDRYKGETRRLHPEVSVAQNLSKDMAVLEKVLGLTPDARLRLPVRSEDAKDPDDAARAAFNRRL